MEVNKDELSLLNNFFFLTAKQVLYACNVAEEDVEKPGNMHSTKVTSWVKENHNASSCIICARIEEELGELSTEEAKEYLQNFGTKDSGVDQLIKSTYSLLGLASYFTAGEKEAKAWTFREE